MHVGRGTRRDLDPQDRQRSRGIPVGLINHRCQSIEDLVGQTYEALTMSFLDLAKGAEANAGLDPRKQLGIIIRTVLSAPSMDPGVFRCWPVFWSMTKQGNALRQVFGRTYGEYRIYLEGLLKRLAAKNGLPQLDVRLAAIGILALVDGLWIEWCLNPATFSTTDAIGLSEAWVDALITRENPAGTRADPE